MKPQLLLLATLITFNLRAQTRVAADSAPAQPAAPRTTSSELITKEWRLRPGTFARLIGGDADVSGSTAKRDWSEFLTNHGVTFPEGANATYVPTSSRLIVRNTVANLNLIDAMVGADETDFQNCLLILEVYVLENADARAVLESELSSNGRYRRVLDLNQTGKARLAKFTALTSRSGQRGVIQGFDEVIYPTEFFAPAAKGLVAGQSTLDTRQVGDSLEFYVTVSVDARSCSLNLVPRLVSLAGFRDFGLSAAEPSVTQPIFNLQQLTTSIDISPNQPQYLGSMNPPSNHGAVNGRESSEIWLAFVRLNLVSPTAAESKSAPKPVGSGTVILEYSFFSLDRAEARRIVVNANTVAEPWKRVEELLAEKKASFEHLTSLRVRSGLRATVDETQETSFPTLFAPPGNPFESASPGPVPKVKSSANDGQTASAPEAKPNLQPFSGQESKPGYPSAFTARNTGLTLETEPILSEEVGVIHLSHVIGRTAEVGPLRIEGIGSQYPEQPVFEARKIGATQNAILGMHTLVGTFNPPGANGVNGRTDDGRTWLLFVRVVPDEP